MKGKQLILVLLRAALGLFFIWSGFVKLQDLSDFTQTVANYQLLSRPWDAVAAYFVPWFEIVVGLALVTGVLAKAGLTLTLLMMIGFTSAIGWVWSQGLNINCGCYGASDEPTNYPVHLAINCGLIALTAALIYFSCKQQSRDQAEVA